MGHARQKAREGVDPLTSELRLGTHGSETIERNRSNYWGHHHVEGQQQKKGLRKKGLFHRGMDAMMKTLWHVHVCSIHSCVSTLSESVWCGLCQWIHSPTIKGSALNKPKKPSFFPPSLYFMDVWKISWKLMLICRQTDFILVVTSIVFSPAIMAWNDYKS